MLCPQCSRWMSTFSVHMLWLGLWALHRRNHADYVHLAFTSIWCTRDSLLLYVPSWAFWACPASCEWLGEWMATRQLGRSATYNISKWAFWACPASCNWLGGSPAVRVISIAQHQLPVRSEQQSSFRWWADTRICEVCQPTIRVSEHRTYAGQNHKGGLLSNRCSLMLGLCCYLLV